MNTSSWASFRSLFDRSSEEKKGAFLRYLSPEEQGKLQQVHGPAKDPFMRPYSVKERIKNVHYSWLITFLEPFAENDKRLILAALTGEQREKLKEYFKVDEELLPLKEGAKEYVTNAVYKWLVSDQKEFLPIEFLPDHPLNSLLTLSKQELQRLVDYLGLHDLAVELKHVIKAEQIKKIQRVLNKDERDYLKSLVKIKEPLTFARLNLDGWNGDAEKLKAILHHRGFNRLAKTLFGCHPSFLWHLSHKLDTGRTKILRKFYTNIKNEETKSALTKQILELIPKVAKPS